MSFVLAAGRPSARALLALDLIGISIAGWLVLRAYWPSQGMLDVSGQPIGRDFVNMWGGAKLMLSGQMRALFADRLYQPAIDALFGQELHGLLWSYPPHIFFLIWPFGLAPYPIGLAVWTLAGFGLFAWAVLGGEADYPGRILLAALALAPASLANALNGQNGFFTAALFLGGFRLLPARPVMAGILFGLLTFKPQIGILIPFALVFGRHWRAIFAAAATASALVLATVALFGIGPWEAYFTGTLGLEREALSRFAGFQGLMMPSVYASLRVLGAGPSAGCIAQIAVAAPVFAATMLALARTRIVGPLIPVLATATFLISPYAFNYDMTLVAGAIALRFREPRPLRPLEYLVYGAVWLIPTAIVPLNASGWPLAPVAVLAFFAVTVRDVFSAPQADAGACRTPASALPA